MNLQRSSIGILLSFFLLINCGLARADSSNAERLYVVSGTEKAAQRAAMQLLPALDGILRQHAVHIIRNNLGMSEQDMAWAQPLLEKVWPEFLHESMLSTQNTVQMEFHRQGIASIERFTAQEQQELLYFYESPLGKKYVETGLELQKQLENFYMPGGGLESIMQANSPKLEKWLRTILSRPNKS